MDNTVPLRQIAHARAGDKGRFGLLFTGEIQRYEIDHLHALNFVMRDGLEGGVNRSLNLDAHGKSFSFLMLSLEVVL